MPDDEQQPKKFTRQRHRRGGGTIFQKVKGKGLWHIQYYRPNPETGRSECVKDYVKLRSKTEAQKLLTERLGQINRGEPFEVGRRRTVGMLYSALHLFTENNSTSKRAVEGLGWRWEKLKPFFAHIPAANVTTALIEKYRSQRLDEHAAKATINHEVGTLRRMYRYGKQSTPPTVHNVPHFPMFRLDNARQGFVEQDAFERMTEEARLDERWLGVLLEVAYTYGWRRGELVNLKVSQLNFFDRTIRLDTGSTKNGEGREVAMTQVVEKLLRKSVEGKKPNDYVFTREDGKPVKDFRGVWRNLCVRAGTGRWVCRKCGEPCAEKTCSAPTDEGSECGGVRKYAGLIPHDLRRSAAKALRRAGVPESVIMATGGWKTASMFRRYAIVSSADQRDAMKALEEARAATKAINPLNDPSEEKPTLEVPVQGAQTIQ